MSLPNTKNTAVITSEKIKYVLNKKKVTSFTSAHLVTSRLISVAVAVMDQQMGASQYRWYQLFLCIHIKTAATYAPFLQYPFTGHLTVLYKQDFTSYFIWS
jgi:hypothetical protein